MSGKWRSGSAASQPLIVPFLGLLGGIYLFIFQPSLDYGLCPLCDGHQYLAAYRYFKGEANANAYQVNFPFHSRIAVPWLAAQFSFGDVATHFKTIQLIFACLTCVLLWALWTRLEVSLSQRILLAGFFLGHWVGIMRLNALDYLTVDVAVYFWAVVWIWIIHLKKWCWLWIAAPLACLHKEVFLALMIWIAVALLVFPSCRAHWMPWREYLGVILVCVILMGWINHQFPATGAPLHSNPVFTLLFYAKKMLLHPIRLWNGLLALATTFGALTWVLVLTKRTNLWQWGLPFWMGWLVIAHWFLALLAGDETTRIYFLSFPFAATWAAVVSKKTPWQLWAAAWLLSLPWFRVFGAIPERAIFWEAAHTWYVEFMPWSTQMGWAAYWLFCGGLLWGFYAVKLRKTLL